MNEQSENFSKNEILSQIKDGKVTMHSRSYLAWRAMLWTLFICLLAVVIIFIVSFTIFVLRASGVWDLPQFGAHGLREFLTFFPWLFVPAALLFAWLLERFVLRYSLAYRLPILYSVVGMTIVIILASLLVLSTPLHDKLYESAINERLPIAGRVYLFFGMAHPDDFYLGEVLSVNGQSYQMKTPEGQKITIVANDKTNFFNGEDVQPNDYVEIIGEETGDNIVAISIKKLNPASPYPVRHYKP